MRLHSRAAIASAVVGECSEAGLSAANTLATVLAALTAATGIVGLLIVATGVLKLAGLVQYVPLPVIGGYLSFVGWFCTVAGAGQRCGWGCRPAGEALRRCAYDHPSQSTASLATLSPHLGPLLSAGVSLATGVQLDGSPASWARLLAPDALLKLAPALGLVVCITLVLRRFRCVACLGSCKGLELRASAETQARRRAQLLLACRRCRRSPLALPALLVAAPLLFYAFLLARGLSLDDAREAGWVSKPQPGDSDWQWWRAWCVVVGGWGGKAGAAGLGQLKSAPAQRVRRPALLTCAQVAVPCVRLASRQHQVGCVPWAGRQAAGSLFCRRLWLIHGCAAGSAGGGWVGQKPCRRERCAWRALERRDVRWRWCRQGSQARHLVHAPPPPCRHCRHPGRLSTGLGLQFRAGDCR